MIIRKKPTDRTIILNTFDFAAAFIAAVVAGQLASSVLMDHFAWLNLPHQPISLSRGIGVILVFFGVLLATRRT